jgi:hypothetical protein
MATAVLHPSSVARFHGGGTHNEKSHGNWAGDGAPAGGGGSGSRTTTGTGTKDDPIVTNDVEAAAKALADNLHVQLESEDVAATLIDELAAIARDAKAKGAKAPKYNLCNVTVPGTSLFCTESKGIPRVKMPQLATGNPVPGSPADGMERTERGEVDLAPAFVEMLEGRGVAVEAQRVPASHLKATQNELDGAKVAGMHVAIEEGSMPPGSIFVTNDNYVVDGHHRWAANVAVGLGDAPDMDMDVVRIDMPIIEVLALANDWTKKMGAPSAEMSLRKESMSTSTLTRPVATFSIAQFKSGTTGADITVGKAVGGMVPWAGVIVVEGVRSGDRRTIEPGALSWPELPLPLMAQWTNPVGGDGHDGATLAGRIDSIERFDDGRVWATGMIDVESPGGPTLLNALSKGLMRGVSVDLDDVEFGTSRDSVKNIAVGRIRGATATPFQAFIESTIELTAHESLAASGAYVRYTARVWTPYDATESLALSLERSTQMSLVAAGAPARQSPIPVEPPLAWFEKQRFSSYTPLTITADGRLYGHIAGFGTCHISFGRCVPVPRSKTNYAAFRNGSVLTAEGETVRTGPIIADTVHPDLKWKASDSMAFYAHSGSALADVIPYEDQFGIAVVGALRPTVKPEEVRALRGSDISPDWRTVNGKPHECVALLAVNVSGFKVPQTLAASAGDYVLPGDTAAAFDLNDELFALVASGAYSTPQESPLDNDDCGCGGHDADDCGCDDDHDHGDELTARLVRQFNVRWSLQERFVPKARVFRAPRREPAVRVFRSPMVEFHASHNQASHGNRAGRRRGGAPVTGDTNQTGGYWEHINRTPGYPNRSGIDDANKRLRDEAEDAARNRRDPHEPFDGEQTFDEDADAMQENAERVERLVAPANARDARVKAAAVRDQVSKMVEDLNAQSESERNRAKAERVKAQVKRMLVHRT